MVGMWWGNGRENLQSWKPDTAFFSSRDQFVDIDQDHLEHPVTGGPGFRKLLEARHGTHGRRPAEPDDAGEDGDQIAQS